ncbi:hypothetical protein KQI84_03745 [bacterium]|nr:hypothetical protein [bacterium]
MRSLSVLRPAILATLTLLVLTFTATEGRAQFAQILIQEDNGLAGMDLYNNGLYCWQNNKTSCGDPGDDRLLWKAYRFDPSSPNYTRLSDCLGIEDGTNIVRNDAHFFYVRDSRVIDRRYATANAGGNDLVTNSALTGYAVTSLAYHDGDVYYGMRSTSTNAFRIYRANEDSVGAAAGVLVATGTGPNASNNWVKKIKIEPYGSSGTMGIFYMVGPEPVAPGDSGLNTLYLKNVGSNSTTPGTVLTDFVQDYAIYTSAFPSSTVIFATRFVPLVRSTGRGLNNVGGYLVHISPASGVVTERYYSIGASVYNVAVDSDNYYFVQNVSGTYSIQRNVISGTGAGTSIQALSSNVGSLTSDGDWLYYIEPRSPEGHYVKRLATSSAAVTLDVREQGLEAIQTTQTLEDSAGLRIPLIAGKDTVVRGYGDLAMNTTGETSWPVDGWLRVYDDGVLVEEFQPRWLARLDGTSGPANTRDNFDNRNPRTFFWIVPGRYITPGTMEFRMTLNESDLAPETETRSNNTVSVSYETRKSGIQVHAEPIDPETPSLIFRPMKVKDQPIIRLRNVMSLPRMIERAKAFVPFSDLTVEEVDSVLQKNILGIDLGPWTMPNEQNWALLNLSVSTLSSNYLYGNLQVAMVPPGVPNFNGVAFPVTGALVRMEGGISDLNSFNQPRGALSIAHEWGHVAGILHIHNTGCGEEPDGPYESGYPWNECNMGPSGSNVRYMGFDRMTRTVVRPTEAGDLMSYRLPRWISGQYYRDDRWRRPTSINTGLRSDARTKIQGDPLNDQLVIGALYEPVSGGYQIANLFAWPAGLAQQPDFPAVGNAGFFKQTLILRDVSGTSLHSQEVDPFPVGDGDAALGMIYSWLPYNNDVHSLEFEVDGATAYVVTRTANAPDVRVAAPEVDAGAGLVRLRWNAWDADGDAIQTMVLYSNDDGTTWRNWGAQNPYNGVDLPLDRLPGGASCRFKLLFSDGMNTVVHDLGPITIDNHPPLILLDGVEEGETIPYGDMITLCALALDADEGSLPADSLVWSLTGPEARAPVGSMVQYDDLLPGEYTLTISAMDSEGASGSTTRHFEIAPVTIPTVGGSAIAIDGRCDDVYEDGSLIRVPYDDGSYYEVRMLHRDGKLYACFSGLQFTTTDPYGRLIAILLDLDNSGGPEVTGSDIAFGVSDDSETVTLVPNGSGAFTFDFESRPGFQVAAIRDGESWGAELCIDDANLGGWNHEVGIQIGQYFYGLDYLWPGASDAGIPDSWTKAWFGEPSSMPQPPPLPPVASAGEDQRINVGSTQVVYLNGTSSYDPIGEDLTYAWTQTSGDSVDLKDADTATPHFEVSPSPTEQVFEFELVVKSLEELTASDSVSITITPNPAPYVYSLEVILNHILGIQMRPADLNGDGQVDSGDLVEFTG